MGRETWESLCLWAKLAAAATAAFWGGLAPLVQVLIAVMAADLLTGLLAGYITRKLSSDVSFRGLAKKAIVLVLVAVGRLLEPAVGLPLGDVVAGFYLVHEGLSILENAARAGLPVPQALREALVKLAPEQRPAPKEAQGG